MENKTKLLVPTWEREKVRYGCTRVQTEVKNFGERVEVKQDVEL